MWKYLGKRSGTTPKELDDGPLLQHESSLADDYQRRHSTVWTKKSFVYLGSCVVLFTTVLVLSILWLKSRSPSLEKILSTSCGDSAQMARENGCIYEPMTTTWIPSECFFAELLDEFDPMDLMWFLDQNRTIRADRDTLLSGDFEQLYTDYSYHVNHCLYMWRKLMVAAGSSHGLIDSRTGNLDHQKHCVRMLARRENTVVQTTAPVYFASCLLLDNVFRHK